MGAPLVKQPAATDDRPRRHSPCRRPVVLAAVAAAVAGVACGVSPDGAAVPGDRDAAHRALRALGDNPAVRVVDPNRARGIQEAIDALPVTGGIVLVPPGTYRQTVSTSRYNLELVGMGNVGAELEGNVGATVIEVPDGEVGFTFNPRPGSTLFLGPILRKLHFRSVSGRGGGVRINRANNFLLDNVSATDFSRPGFDPGGAGGSYGIYIDGTGNLSQYGTLFNCRAYNDRTGLLLRSVSGLRVTGCHFDGSFNGGAPPPGSRGIHVARCATGSYSSGTGMFSGNVLQGFDVLVHLEEAENDQLVGNRFEVFGAAAIRLSGGTGVQIMGGSINNHLRGGTGTAVDIAAGVTRTRVDLANVYAARTVTDLNDPATATTEFNVNDVVWVPAGKRVYAGGRLLPRHLGVTRDLRVAVPPRRCADQEVAVPGAAPLDGVTLGLPAALARAPGLACTAYVTRRDAVGVRCCNLGAAPVRLTAPVRVDVWSNVEPR
ncbi:MAG: right-handed parallel beta-helix repeat-containing protein [Deltaproteobacteria bacterium]|nr:right-handed parallel beta-helix repeat-containing protein [Deltaproteobacteria bacterium]